MRWGFFFGRRAEFLGTEAFYQVQSLRANSSLYGTFQNDALA